HTAEYRDRARRALDVLLSRLKPDGALPTLARDEVPLQVAAYAQEAWMAAGWLDDPALRPRLCTALGAHVRWVLRFQKPDGTWMVADPRGAARVDALANLLLWVDAGCGEDPAVYRAIERARSQLCDAKKLGSQGFYNKGDLQEVRQALAGRAIAALA